MLSINYSHEALEIFNIKKFSLSDCSSFCNPLLKDYNVYNFTFALEGDDVQAALVTFLHALNHYCGMYILQECSDLHAKVTFVTSMKYSNFVCCLHRILRRVSKYYPGNKIVDL